VENSAATSPHSRASRAGITGSFSSGIPVKVGGMTVAVRGAVVNGVVEIGTAFK
jgi:hypothetical protein